MNESYKETNEYLEKFRIRDVMESIVVGISFNKPQDPLEYIGSCLTTIKEGGLISNNPKGARIRWNTFLPSLSNAYSQPASNGNEGIVVRKAEIIPALHPFRKSVGENPILAARRLGTLPTALPAIGSVVAKSEDVKKEEPLYHNNIVFVLGGPGSGKGTQCAKLSKDFNLLHLSTGDLLRDHVQRKTEIGKIAADIMKEGGMVPSSLLMTILREKVEEGVNNNVKGFLIDGFPRSLEQAVEFEEKIGPCRGVLAYKCSMETLELRLIERGKSSGRSDDNLESIRRRFEMFTKESEPVIEYFKGRGKCLEISSEAPIEEVYKASTSLFTLPTPINHPNLVFVLGGPGAGKGTQCTKIVEEFKYLHLSTGDLLRREVEQCTPVGLQVSNYLANGKMAPMDIILFLLKKEISENVGAKGILIDGFPRAMDQALEFERIIGSPRAILSFTCPLEVLKERLLKRGETSGRSDDNSTAIVKRFETFKRESLPVIAYFKKGGKAVEIRSTTTPEEVFQDLKSKLKF